MHLDQARSTGQLRQYLVCMLATCTSIYRMKNQYTYNDMCNFKDAITK